MSVKERIREFIKFKGISIREFCRNVGLSETYVNSMRSSLQPDKLLKIAHAYPDLNIEWLITGEGDMMRLSNALSRAESEEIISTGSEVFKDKLIEMFKTGEIFSSIIVWEQHRLIIDKSKQIEDLLTENERLKMIIQQHGIKLQ